MANTIIAETFPKLELPQKCRDCHSLATWITTGLTVLNEVTDPNKDALLIEIISLANRCADPSEGDNCFAGDDMFAGIIESDIKAAASAGK